MTPRRPHIDKMESAASSAGKKVRVLDLAKFFSGDTEEQALFCQELVQCLRDVGFVKLINHGIAEADQQRLFTWVNTKLRGTRMKLANVSTRRARCCLRYLMK